MSAPASGRNLVLVGMMGAGKSSVGRLLAAALARPLVDTDALVEAEAGQTVAEVFAAEGEPGFRRREAAAVRAAAAASGQVIAAGGGAELAPANVAALRATGDVVHLAAAPETLAARLDAQAVASRPLIGGAPPRAGSADGSADRSRVAPAARLAVIASQRGGAYRRAADHVIDTDGLTAATVADAVLAWARARPGLLSSRERAA